MSSAIRYGFNNKPYLNRNITIEPANPAAITQPVTVRIYFTQAEFNALKTVDNTINTIADLRIIKVAGNSCMTAITGSGTIIIPAASGTYGTFGNGYFLEFTTASFSTFFIASAAAAPVLPLNLLSFTASYNGQQVLTKWTTANEINTKSFIVERSADGQNFTSIGVVNAVNISGQNQYVFTDKNPLEGVSYYRLQLVDKNGNFRYSNVVVVKYETGFSFCGVSKPCNQQYYCSHPQATGGSTLELMTIEGKKISTYYVAASALQTTINVSELSNGSYVLVYKNNGKKSVSSVYKKIKIAPYEKNVHQLVYQDFCALYCNWLQYAKCECLV